MVSVVTMMHCCHNHDKCVLIYCAAIGVDEKTTPDADGAGSLIRDADSIISDLKNATSNDVRLPSDFPTLLVGFVTKNV